MNKLANMRHWSERMSPGFGMSRGPPGGPNMAMAPGLNPQQQANAQPGRLNGPGIGLGLSTVPMGGMAGPGSLAGPPPGGQMAPQNGSHHPHLQHLDGGVAQPGPAPTGSHPPQIVHYAFNVPLSSDLAGPDTEDILHATTDAVLRWTHPEDAPDDVPVHELPVHVENLNHLRQQCRMLCTGALAVLDAQVVGTVPRLRSVSDVSLSAPPGVLPPGAPAPTTVGGPSVNTTSTPTTQGGSTTTTDPGNDGSAAAAAAAAAADVVEQPPRPMGPQVTTVYLAGDPELVMKARGKLLNEAPLLVSWLPWQYLDCMQVAAWRYTDTSLEESCSKERMHVNLR